MSGYCDGNCTEAQYLRGTVEQREEMLGVAAARADRAEAARDRLADQIDAIRKIALAACLIAARPFHSILDIVGPMRHEPGAAEAVKAQVEELRGSGPEGDS